MCMSRTIIFNWKTTFPEQRMNEALLSLGAYFKKHNRPCLPEVIHVFKEVRIVRELFHAFNIPENEIAGRMDALGMREAWEVTYARAEPYLEHVRQLESPEDKRVQTPSSPSTPHDGPTPRAPLSPPTAEDVVVLTVEAAGSAPPMSPDSR
ncbi:hypothetical protein B0H17DRAFT_1192104 [Mycena rosella]|uniref:Uncharacterized protein n=1 Tax=Mycena rosella TaxID=1033263 RepID=A0AAD7MAC9_MYCRO|nr:hypothetical protein B0H17DRAFT_1192104 [Mycena rosella]